MRVGDALRRRVHALLRLGPVNRFVHAILRPLVPILPRRLLERVPVVGRVSLALSRSRRLVFTSDGRENLASVLYWGGVKSFEPETRSLFEKLLPLCDVVFDVGAYVGFYAMLAALDDPAREVHAFEPVPRNFERLVTNLSANGLERVAAVCAAAGNHDGEVPLYVPGGVWLPSHSSTRAGFREAGEVLRARALRLDSYADENRIGRIDLIKIDTEGTEHEVLEGARGRLARDRPWIVCEVLRGLTEEPLNAFFAGRSYAFFLLTAEGPVRQEEIRGDASYRDRNFLFAPEESLDRLFAAGVREPA